MMENKLLTKIDLYVFIWGLIIVVCSLFFMRSSVIGGAAVGAGLAALNWVGFRWAGIRMAASGNKAVFGVFLAVKSLVVLTAVFLILATERVSPIAFMFGLSSLVLGIFTRSMHLALAKGHEALKEEQR